MEIIFNALFKIDIDKSSVEQLQIPSGNNDFKAYIVDLLGKIVQDPDKKGFVFQSDTKEVKILIERIIQLDENDHSGFDLNAKAIAERLHAKEVESDAKNNLNVEMLKGVAVISLVRFDDGRQKAIISKADYNEFLDAQSYSNRDGFPLRKKIYKAFVADIEDDGNISKVSVFDTNSGFTVYWWRDFLELEKIHTDEHNTEQVFAAIDTKILTPLRRKHKQDYITLTNATIHYFRVAKEFTVEGYLSSVLSVDALDSTLDMKDLRSRTEGLFKKGNYDNRFTIVSDLVTKKFKKTINLTPQIDLTWKGDIKNIENAIRRYKEDNGTKWVMVKSDEGFEYFKDADIIKS